jgi:hypothetical protein
MEAGCFICRKHRGDVAVAGGPIFDDALLFAAHLWETPHGVPDHVYVGHVFVETKRHVAYLSDLSVEEAAAAGPPRVAAQRCDAARGLRPGARLKRTGRHARTSPIGSRSAGR